MAYKISEKIKFDELFWFIIIPAWYFTLHAQRDPDFDWKSEFLFKFVLQYLSVSKAGWDNQVCLFVWAESKKIVQNER